MQRYATGCFLTPNIRPLGLDRMGLTPVAALTLCASASLREPEWRGAMRIFRTGFCAAWARISAVPARARAAISAVAAAPFAANA